MSKEAALQEFEEMAAAIAAARRSAAGVVEPSHTNPIAPVNASVESGPVKPATMATPVEKAELAKETATTNQPLSPLAALDLDTAIRLRWALRDIKGKRTKFAPLAPGDLQTLIEMGLAEMRDDTPALTDAGYREID